MNIRGSIYTIVTRAKIKHPLWIEACQHVPELLNNVDLESLVFYHTAYMRQLVFPPHPPDGVPDGAPKSSFVESLIQTTDDQVSPRCAIQLLSPWTFTEFYFTTTNEVKENKLAKLHKTVIIVLLYSLTGWHVSPVLNTINKFYIVMTQLASPHQAEN